MALGYIISLVIFGVSLIGLIVFGVVVSNKIKPILKNLEETQSAVTDRVNYYTHETEVIQSKVENIVDRVEKVQNESETKLESFDKLSSHASELGDALSHLKDQSGDLSKGIASNTFEELKTDGPRLAKTFKLALKRTFQKQKDRKNK